MSSYIEGGLDSVVGRLSDENYAQSFAFYRFWFDVGQTYHQIASDRIFGAIWNCRRTNSIDPEDGQLIHSTAHLIIRFASDAESDHLLAPQTSGLQNRLSTSSLREFFNSNMMLVTYEDNNWGNAPTGDFYANVNLMAHWANLGYVEEAAIRNHILQSLVSHPKLYGHQANALIILFKLAGATFARYADPSVVDRCFKLLEGHNGRSVTWGLIQSVIGLRKCGWAGLPSPPTFTAGKPKLAGTGQKDPAATPVGTSLGLPSRDLEPRALHPLPPESVAAPESDTIPASPVTQSPSISIATLSDFTIADTSDGEPFIDPTIGDTSDDGLLINPAAAVPHETFYLEDGNVEVLCGNTLFRVHTTILSFHSPVLRRMFAQINLATAESPNGCPRILSSDDPKDFSTLLKMIYLPGFPERNKVPSFAILSSLLRITTKYDMPTVRSQLLEVVRDAYPDTFEGLDPSRQIGECVFSGPIPHPNEVLNLFVQQNITSALPMAYYMAARRGLGSLMDRHLPRSATLPPGILQSTIGGLMALREVELNETHHLTFGSKDSHSCSTSNCPLRTPTSPAALEAYQKVFDHIAGSSQLGTKVLQVPEFYEDHGGDTRCVVPGICRSCVERWESGHAELRKKVWATLPEIFGLRG